MHAAGLVVVGAVLHINERMYLDIGCVHCTTIVFVARFRSIQQGFYSVQVGLAVCVQLDLFTRSSFTRFFKNKNIRSTPGYKYITVFTPGVEGRFGRVILFLRRRRPFFENVKNIIIIGVIN